MKKLISRLTLLGLFSLISFVAFAQTRFDSPEITTNGLYKIEANWSELKHGWSNLVLKVSSPDQAQVIGAKLSVNYDMAEMPMSPPNKPIVDKGDGTYEKKVFFGMSGPWKFDITIETATAKDALSREQVIR